jgi:hypothetical protein
MAGRCKQCFTKAQDEEMGAKSKYRDKWACNIKEAKIRRDHRGRK